mmetsp:Transcript_93418/g.180111  ORF Transcript_93418/g.180111 Transcript_93418/m.180111 type:complete len:270 (+) Transcript_93418:93-902(+)
MMQRALLEYGSRTLSLRSVRFWRCSCCHCSFQISIRQRCSSLKSQKAAPTAPSSSDVSGETADRDGHATGGSADCNVPDADGVFESRPSPSGADVAHNKAAGNHARDAEALILAAAELDENAAGGVFEKQPQQSAADIRHADSNSRHAAQAEAEIVAAADEDISRCSKSVFESKPQQSAADLRHSDSFQASDNAVVFESDPKPSQAHVGHGKAVQKVLENAGTAGVFESAPIKSTADAHHDETEVWGSEYETDESEDEVELPPTNLHAS